MVKQYREKPLIARFYKFIIIPFIHKQKLLIKRRGGLKSHIELTVRFAEIGQDPWVKKAREQNG